MTFPRELTLRRCPEGLRMFSNPVREIEKLHKKEHRWKDLPLAPGQNPLDGLRGDLFDVRMEIDLGDAAEVGLRAAARPCATWSRRRNSTCRIASAPVEPIGNRLKLQILVDRISLEAFAQDGKANLNAMFMPKEGSKPLELFAVGGAARLVSLQVFELASAWDRGPAGQSDGRPQEPRGRSRRKDPIPRALANTATAHPPARSAGSAADAGFRWRWRRGSPAGPCRDRRARKSRSRCKASDRRAAA